MCLKCLQKKQKNIKITEIYQALLWGLPQFHCFFLLIIKITFEWSFLDYFANFFKGTFILGTVIDAIPDFLEKNVKRIIWDLIFISIMILILFVF